MGLLTVEAVVEAAARDQHGTFGLNRRQNTVEDQVEEVVGGHGGAGLPAREAVDAILGPADLALKLSDRDGAGAQQRRRGAARDVVADKGEDVAEDREAKRDARGTEPSIDVSDACRRGENIGCDREARLRSLIAVLVTYGPPNSYPCA